MGEMFRSQEIPGKGYGVIAVREIQEGELLLSEPPLIQVPWWVRHSMYPQVEKKEFLERAVKHLDKKKREEFWSLHDSKVPDGAEKTIVGIWRTNNFALGVSGPKANNGLFLKMSRFNHSCSPSAEFHWNQRKGRQEIRSVRNISKGEEITISYFTNQVAVLNQRGRKEYLQSHYGFPCDCSACSLQGAEREKNDWERAEISRLEDRIERLFYDIEEEEDPEVDRLQSDNSNDVNSDLTNSKLIGGNLNSCKNNQPIPNCHQSDEDNSSCEDVNHNYIQNNIDSSDSKDLVDQSHTTLQDNGNLNFTNQNIKHTPCEDEDKDEQCVLEGLNLCFIRLELMKRLGLKIVSQLQVYKLVYDTAMEWDFPEKAVTAAQSAAGLSTTLYGSGSMEWSSWKSRLQHAQKYININQNS